MPTRISELEFDKVYTGILTDSPKEFGIFVEFEEYFTGLLHKTEFLDYDSGKSTYKVGDKIDFYVKDVSYKKGQYRIFLTLTQEGVNEEKLQWTKIKNMAENRTFAYTVDLNDRAISINIDGEDLRVALGKTNYPKRGNFPLVKVFKVDPINKRMKFDFVGEEN